MVAKSAIVKFRINFLRIIGSDIGSIRGFNSVGRNFTWDVAVNPIISWLHEREELRNWGSFPKIIYDPLCCRS